MNNRISHVINHSQQHPFMVPVATLVMQRLNIKAGQISCSEGAEFLGYSCAPMPLCG
ncbi:hypothetical protein [Pseudomonas sp. M30-35]|uniref:hypothetical protein n=1 Tax=Pseudomonas sp. M30-35 TaxID=1981174 RepID=UPI0012FE486D|nr:hypothetical protein [Pseudomonas sp. M30-35]